MLDGFSGQLFHIFDSIYYCFLVAICNLVYNVEAIFHLHELLIAIENIFLNVSDVCTTAICSFTFIIHTSEKISRYMLAAQLT